MKKDNMYQFGHAFRQKEIADNVVIPEILEEPVQVPDAKDSFLSIVYALDPITNLPTGDLSYMASDKANPEVKQWVLQNLLIDVSSAAVPTPPSGLSDDDIIALSRDPKEDMQSYLNRVNTYAKSNAELYARLSQQQEESRSVSDKSGSSSVSSE